jgi:hypothetical protein
LRALMNTGSLLQPVFSDHSGWHHFLPRKQMCQAYAAMWLVLLFRLRWIIQDNWLLMPPCYHARSANVNSFPLLPQGYAKVVFRALSLLVVGVLAPKARELMHREQEDDGKQTHSLTEEEEKRDSFIENV